VGEKPVESQRTAAYDTLLRMLRELREEQGVSQRELCKRLDRPFTYMVKIEAGTRRLDVVELIEICKALEASPKDFLFALLDELD
jgi:transcriptional regulator with XRE-family HTH domain